MAIQIIDGVKVEVYDPPFRIKLVKLVKSLGYPVRPVGEYHFLHNSYHANSACRFDQGFVIGKSVTWTEKQGFWFWAKEVPVSKIVDVAEVRGPIEELIIITCESTRELKYIDELRNKLAESLNTQVTIILKRDKTV